MEFAASALLTALFALAAVRWQSHPTVAYWSGIGALLSAVALVGLSADWFLQFTGLGQAQRYLFAGGATLIVLGACWPLVASHILKAMPATVAQKPTSIAPQAPELMLSLIGGNVFAPDAKDLRNRLTGISLDAKVWNIGVPSVAVGWGLSVISEDGVPVIAQLTKMPESLRLRGTNNNALIHASDSLEERTKSLPVGTIPVEGKLLFYVAMQRNLVLAPSTKLELTVSDIYGKQSKVTQLMGDWLAR